MLGRMDENEQETIWVLKPEQCGAPFNSLEGVEAGDVEQTTVAVQDQKVYRLCRSQHKSKLREPPTTKMLAHFQDARANGQRYCVTQRLQVTYAFQARSFESMEKVFRRR